MKCKLFVIWSIGILLTLVRKIQSQGASKQFVIGAIFDKDDVDLEIAFKQGIKDSKNYFDSSKYIYDYQLVPAIETITNGDSFEASQKACKLLEKSPVVIFGPGNSLSSSQVRSICNEYQIPYVETSAGYRLSDSQTAIDNQFTINMYPYYKSFGEALNSYVTKAEHWETLFILYYKEESLLKFESLMNTFKRRVRIRQWKKTDKSYKYVMKYLNSLHQMRFIVDIPYTEVNEFLRMATEYNMTNLYYSYIFTDLDTPMIDLSTHKSTIAANLTVFSITASDDQIDKGNTMPLMRNNIHAAMQKKLGTSGLLPHIPARAALTYDGVCLVALGLVDLSQFIHPIHTSTLSCKSRTKWTNGLSVTDKIRNGSMKPAYPLTGQAKFDSNGWRKHFNLTILEVTTGGYQQFGYWNSEKGTIITKKYSQTKKELSSQLKNSTLRVTTIENMPFLFLKPNANKATTDPNDYLGFTVELIRAIAAECEFNFTIHLVADGKYGKINFTHEDGTEEWDGMIGELMTNKADLAVAPLTITYERERAIDFTTPYMSLGLSILYRRPKGKKPGLFSFLQPLSPPVWGYVLAAYISVSFILFVIARFSPYEWYSPHTCNAETDILENQFSMLNSLWFTIGSLMQQGSDIAPRSNSTRIVAGIWWFFTLIIISSYTANLAAFLTSERMQLPIENAEDLSKQVRIQYGMLDTGSTYSFFQKSQIATYKKMWEYMDSHKSVLMTSTDDGIEKVMKEDYAFILESVNTEYWIQRNCTLMQVGGLLDSKGYGIGLPQGSGYRDPLSEAILKLQLEQEIEKMRRYWWGKFNINTTCAAQEDKKDTASLRIEDVAGVFVMLFLSFGLSLFVSIIEFLYKTRRNASKEKIPMSKKLISDLIFAMRIFRSKKKVKRQKTSSTRSRATTNSVGAQSGQVAQQNSNSYFQNNPLDPQLEEEPLSHIRPPGGVPGSYRLGVMPSNPPPMYHQVATNIYPMQQRPSGDEDRGMSGSPLWQRSFSDRFAQNNDYL